MAQNGVQDIGTVSNLRDICLEDNDAWEESHSAPFPATWLSGLLYALGNM
jgi:hypothetical protein